MNNTARDHNLSDAEFTRKYETAVGIDSPMRQALERLAARAGMREAEADAATELELELRQVDLRQARAAVSALAVTLREARDVLELDPIPDDVAVGMIGAIDGALRDYT